MSAGEISASGPNAGQLCRAGFSEVKADSLALPHYSPQRGQDSVIDIDAPYLL
jgi:hypothetical protein